MQYNTLIIIFAPWLLPLTFSWHRGIKVIFQIRRCVLCLHAFSSLPRLLSFMPKQRAETRSHPPTSLPCSSRLPHISPSCFPSLSLSSFVFHSFLSPLSNSSPAIIHLSLPLASFLPPVSLFSPSPLLHLWLLQVFSVCRCGALWEWLNHHTQSVWHGTRIRLHTSLPNAANGMN